MGIVNTLLRAITWWNGQTLNTQIFTWRKGEKVGEDDQGNIYYRTKNDSKPGDLLICSRMNGVECGRRSTFDGQSLPTDHQVNPVCYRAETLVHRAACVAVGAAKR